LNIKETLAAAIEAACGRAISDGTLPAGKLPAAQLDVPPQKSFGDFATNFAMQAAKSLRVNPRALALAVEKNIECPLLDKIEIVNPGFMNFFLKKEWLYESLARIAAQGGDYGNLPKKSGEYIQVEFVSANPTGPLHIGHGRGAAVGSALVSLLRAAGYEVASEYYINDAGNQINNLAASVNARYLELLKVPCDFPEDGYHGADIVATAERIVKADGDKYLGLSTKDRIALFRAIALKEKIAILREDLEAFRVRFDSWFSEQTLHDGGAIEKCCADLSGRGYLYEKDGAKWLRSTSFGDDKDRVVIRENGAPTYLAADIAYHENKFSRGFTRLVNLWGADHHGYIKRMKAACAALGYDGGRLEVLILQMVSLFRDGELVKMSKRTGQSVTLNELVEEVGTDAARFFFVMRSIDSQLDFDINLAIEKAPENPVYYIQYAHARICSVFRQMAETGAVLGEAADLSLLREECELELIRKLDAYAGEIESAAKDRAPHRIARFAHELTGLFHSFYQQCRILGVEENTQAARLTLARAVRDCLRHSLGLLGISAPEYM
jgi:arginyl-tRNA synthetase